MNNYSYNDFRNYQELYHRNWDWPNGNNSKEYNHWYYMTHPEKWKQVAGEAIDKIVKETDTDLDNKAWEYAKKKAPAVKKELTNFGNYVIDKSKTKVDNYLRASYIVAKKGEKDLAKYALKEAGRAAINEPIEKAKRFGKGVKKAGKAIALPFRGLKNAITAGYRGTKAAIETTVRIANTLKNPKKLYTTNPYEKAPSYETIARGQQWIDEHIFGKH